MKREISIYSIGKKIGEGNYFENLLWFINHYNTYFTNKYEYKCGVIKLITDEDIKFSYMIIYKDTVIMFREISYNFGMYQNKPTEHNEQMEKRFYYEIMNNFLGWTSAEDIKKSIESFRKDFTYEPLNIAHSVCRTLIESELINERR